MEQLADQHANMVLAQSGLSGFGNVLISLSYLFTCSLKKIGFLVLVPPLSPSISLALCHVYLSLFISLFYIYLSIDLLAGPSRKILLTIYSSDFLSVFHYHISYKPIDLSWYIPNKMSPISCPICPFKLLLLMHYGKPCLQSIQMWSDGKKIKWGRREGKVKKGKIQEVKLYQRGVHITA